MSASPGRSPSLQQRSPQLLAALLQYMLRLLMEEYVRVDRRQEASIQVHPVRSDVGGSRNVHRNLATALLQRQRRRSS